MATRYAQNTPIQPVDNFFRLPLNELAMPILAKQQKYDETQSSLEEFYAQMADNIFLPEDNLEQQVRMENFNNKEKALRESVSGDLTNPEYTKKLNEMIREESNNKWYKDAAWTAENFKVWQAATLDQSKIGPISEWQDSFGSQLKSFKGSKYGPLTFTGIKPRPSIHLEGLSYLDKHIQALRDSTDIEEQIVGGRKVLVSKTHGELTIPKLVDILDGLLVSSPSLKTEEMEFNNNPDLFNKWGGDFKAYYREEVLPSIAKVYAQKYEVTEYRAMLDDETRFSEETNRGRKAHGEDSKEIKTAFDLYLPEYATGAAFGLAVADLADRGIETYNKMADDLIYGAVDADGKRDYSFAQKIQGSLNLSDLSDNNPAVTVIPTNIPGKGPKVDVTLSLEDETTGKISTYNISSQDLIKDFNNLPDNIKDALGKIKPYMINTMINYNNYKLEAEDIAKTNEERAKIAFGDDYLKYRTGGVAALSSPEDYAEVKSKGNILRSSYSGPDNIALKADVLFDLGVTYPDLKDYLGLEYSETMAHPRSIFEANKTRNAIERKLSEIGGQVPQELISILEKRALEERGALHPGFKKLDKIYRDAWEKGIDPKTGIAHNVVGDPSGQKQQEFIYYSLNSGADATGKNYVSGLYELIATSINSITEKDLNQVGGNSKTILFNEDTNTSPGIQEYKDLMSLPIATEASNELKYGFKIKAFKLDTFNTALVIQGLKGSAKGKNYEIRDPLAVEAYLADIGLYDLKMGQIMKDMLASFKAGTEEEKALYPGVKEGQYRTRTHGYIGDTEFIRPVQKLTTEEIDPSNQQKYKEGAFKYTSMNPDRGTVYANSPYEIAIHYLFDRREFLENIENLVDISAEDYSGRFSNISNIKYQKVSPEIKNAMDAYPKSLFGELKLTRGYTPMDEAVGGYVQSFHTNGNAIDVSLRDPETGEFTDKYTMTTIAKMVADNEDPNGWAATNGVRIWIEAPADHPLIDGLIAKYGYRNVRIVPHADQLHAHIEYVGKPKK